MAARVIRYEGIGIARIKKSKPQQTSERASLAPVRTWGSLRAAYFLRWINRLVSFLFAWIICAHTRTDSRSDFSRCAADKNRFIVDKGIYSDMITVSVRTLSLSLFNSLFLQSEFMRSEIFEAWKSAQIPKIPRFTRHRCETKSHHVGTSTGGFPKRNVEITRLLAKVP